MTQVEIIEYIKKFLIHKNKKNCLNATAVQHGYLNNIKNELDIRYADNISLQEKLYLFYYNLNEPPKCICGKTLTFIKFSKGYRRFCRSCSQKQNHKKGDKCHFFAKKSIERIFQEKYNVNNPSQLKSVQEKRKSTFIQNYGTDNPWKSDKIIKKIKDIKFYKLFSRFMTSEAIMSRVDPLFSLNDFKGNNSLYKWKCKLCGNEFEDSLKDRRIPRCQNCFPFYGSTSNLEKEIANWIKSLNIQVIENSKLIIPPLE